MAKTRRELTFPLMLVLLALAATLSSARPAFADRYGLAVIVGNGNYANERVPKVAYAHRDAEAFKRYVLDVLGFDPDRVFDLRDATQAELFTWFGSRDSHEGLLWRYLHPRHGSDVVVFYSGHGVPGLKNRRSYLVPSDADPDTPEINGYPIDLLYTNLGKSAEAKSVRVFLDAGFSGESDRGMLVRSALPVDVQASLPEAVGKKLTVLSAASGKEVASWDENAGHGMFTHHLLDALYGKADADGDGQVTAAEAKTYLDDTMTVAVRVEFGRYQTASLVGLAGTVLSRAGTGGVFPARPSLDFPGSISGVRAEEAESSVATTGGAEDPPSVDTAESVEASLGLTHRERVLVQHGLSSLGEDVGVADGVFGRRTRAGIRSYQEKKGLPETGYLTGELRETLVEASLGLEHAQRGRVQIGLWALGFNPGSPTGQFDQSTRDAIRKWQAHRGEETTGYLGPGSAKALLAAAPDLTGPIWLTAQNQPCKVWNPNPMAGEVLTWSGDCVGGKASGSGQQVWQGSYGEEIYEGEYQDGKKHGHGVLTYNDGSRFLGEWRSGKRDSLGITIFANDDVYEGEHQGRKLHGFGTMSYANGSHYVGEWMDGKHHGLGTYTDVLGKFRHEGEYKDGKRSGNGVVVEIRTGQRSEGVYRNGKREGIWISTYSDGGRQEVTFRGGVRHGPVTWIEPDGKVSAKYIWRDGKIVR